MKEGKDSEGASLIPNTTSARPRNSRGQKSAGAGAGAGAGVCVRACECVRLRLPLRVPLRVRESARQMFLSGRWR